MLKQRALTATLWSGVDLFFRQGVQFATAIVLAHLLAPSDFGVFALLALFTGIATLFVDGGFSAALIQRQDVDHTDESTVFWINLGVGAAVAILLWLAAPAIAVFYAQPILVPIMAVLACSVFLGALGAIHTTLLTKRLDFRKQMVAGLAATVFATATALWMAWKGYGVWALAAQSIVTTGATTAMLWRLSAWRPSATFSRASTRKLFGFGGYYLAFGVLEITYARMYTLLIGKFYGPQQLGYYNNADTTRQLSGSFLSGVLSRVVFPMFSAAANDAAVLRRGMQFAVRAVMLINAPIMLGMAVTAEPLVLVLYGTQWLPAVPILRVLCLSGLLWPLHALNPYMLLSQNLSRLMFRVEATKKVVGMLMLGLGAFFGLLGIAWAVFAFNLIAFVINAHYARKFIDYGIGAQLRDFMPSVGAATIMAAVVYLVGAEWAASPAIKLVGLALLGASVFFAIAWLTNAVALHEVASLFRRTRNKPSDIV